MATTPTQIRIDASIKQEASALFSRLGLDMSSTVNMFLSSFVADSLLPWRFQRTARKPLMLWQKPAVFPTILMSNDIPVWKI